MAIFWVDLRVLDDSGALLTSDAARGFIDKKIPGLINPAADASLLAMVVDGTTVADAAALIELQRKLPNRVEHTVRQAKASAEAFVRREEKNVLRMPPPEYTVTLELGDIDALFQPYGGGAPHADLGVRQRLLALGYMYFAPDHTHIDVAAQRCWEYYKRVHNKWNEADALDTLKEEVQHTILCGSLGRKTTPFPPGKLPAPRAFGAIRLPGGYTGNMGAAQIGGNASGPGTYTLDKARDPNYDMPVGGDRYAYEEKLAAANLPFGKVPIMAKVEVRHAKGSFTPAKGVPVYFELADPADVDDPTGAAFKAPALRDNVMDYSKNWVLWDVGEKPTTGYTNLPGTPDFSRDEFRKITDQDWAADLAEARRIWGDEAKAGAARQADLDAYCRTLTPSPGANQPPPSPPGSGAPPPPPPGGVADFQRPVRARKLITYLMKHAPPYILPGGPRSLVDFQRAKFADKAGVGNPQGSNVPSIFGGKSDLPVAGGVFDDPAADRDGFHQPYPSQTLQHGNLTKAVAGTGAQKYAMKALTNDKGYAGVLFTPSRCGGDRYRLRAYIDPLFLLEEKAVGGVPLVETGTLVVWRNVRLNKYVQMATPLAPLANGPFDRAINYLFKDLPGQPPGTKAVRIPGHQPQDPSGKVYALMELGTPVKTAAVFAGQRAEAPLCPRTDPRQLAKNITLSGINAWLKHYRPIDHTYIGFEEQLNRCYCELLDDTGGAPIRMDAAMKVEIMAEARRLATMVTPRMGYTAPENTVDWNLLLLDDDTSPFLYVLRSFEEYNAVRGRLPELQDQPHSAQLKEVIDQVFDGLMEWFADGGYYPGLTLVQVPRGATWDKFALNHEIEMPSGKANGTGACMVCNTNGMYTGPNSVYPTTANTIHEFGHCLGLAHDGPYPGGPDDNQHQRGQPSEAFKPPAPEPATAIGPDVCVMGYYGCFGEFCGRCSMTMMGWKTKSTAYPAGA